MQLNDTHLVLLSTAAQRNDHLLTPPAKPGRATDKLSARLESARLVEAVSVGTDQPHWRLGADGEPIGLRLLPAGFEALGLRPDVGETDQDEGTSNAAASQETAASPARQTKRARLIAMLQREEGASIEAIMAAMGWLPHTSRAALTGLRKTGYQIVKAKDGQERTIYRLDAPAAEVAAPVCDASAA